MQESLTRAIARLLCLATLARGHVHATVTHRGFDPISGGSVTLRIDRDVNLCCSFWDWVGIYQDGSRLKYVHAEDEENPSFSVTFFIPSGGGTFTFAYSTPMDDWRVHDLGLELTFTDAPEPLPAGVTAAVSQQVWDASTGWIVALTVARGPELCCSAWDWVGIYKDGARLSFVHSGDKESPSFFATFSIPNKGGTFTFAYSTSLDGWRKHDLDLELTFSDSTVWAMAANDDYYRQFAYWWPVPLGLAPALSMATIIPSYWSPTSTCWRDLHAAVEASGLPAHKVSVILNPNSGNITYAGVPSVASWTLWQHRAANLSNAGFKTLAYLNLCSNVVAHSCAGGQGDKAFSGEHGVKAEIDKYIAKFGASLAGIFFDDASHMGLHTDAILEATRYASSLGLVTLHNPGVMSGDPVLFSAVTVTVLREGSDPGTVNPFAAGLPAAKSAMILHSVPGTTWRDYFLLAQARGFKYFYATESWSSCPYYLEEQLAAIASTLLKG